jgi:hypothetical protein
MVYRTPSDAAPCLQAFLAILHNPHPTLISAFNFSEPGMLDQIDIADAAGVPGWIFADHSQFCTPSEKNLVAARAAKWRNWEITVGTVEYGPKPGEINHRKNMVVLAPDGSWTVWRGSLNFSTLAYTENNEASVVVSNIYGIDFATLFVKQRALARQHQPQYQVAQPLLVPRDIVTTFGLVIPAPVPALAELSTLASP